MAVLDRIAYFQNRRDEVPNQVLAQELARTRDAAGIAEIAAGLGNKNQSVRSDCLKVLYEIGYLSPELIAGHVGDFLKLPKDKDNRMVWGAMIALAAIAGLRPAEIWARVDDVIAAVEKGTVITVVWGIRALARVAAADPAYSARIFPVLMRQLRAAIPRDVPTHAESIAPAVNRSNMAEFLAVVESRRGELTPSQAARLKTALKAIPGGQ
jgi:hypothetical protein